jgi:sialate O-acetylesterase
VRQDFKNETMPFYIVQLSAWGRGEQYWPAFRVAQAKVRDTIPNTGLALSLDKGDKIEIHPRDKKPVGQRLAYLALDDVYGLDTPSRGPNLKSAWPKADEIILTFDHVEEGLKTSGGEVAVNGFEIAGSDKQFVVAVARITGKNEITLRASSVAQPKFARYAWNGFFEPSLNLYNSANLPSEPFLTD